MQFITETVNYQQLMDKKRDSNDDFDKHGFYKVFFDISIDGDDVGRIEMKLLNSCPKTVENFK